jgi:hypothetical protein
VKRCCTGDCQQGRTCPARRSIRWPVLCTRCGSLSHFAEDCTRMPARMGVSQQERDLLDQVRRDRNAVILAALVFVLALVVTGAP